jgi:Domain of unknown function (DUF4156)
MGTATFADYLMNRPVQFVALVALVATLTLLPACTWVKPTVSAENVRVAYDGNVSGCRDAGAISVSVTAKVAFYHRSDLKVRDELETLARNQAAGIPADTIKAIDEPKDGAQNFQAYVCGGVRLKQRGDTSRPKEEAQTFPIKDH